MLENIDFELEEAARQMGGWIVESSESISLAVEDQAGLVAAYGGEKVDPGAEAFYLVV